MAQTAAAAETPSSLAAQCGALRAQLAAQTAAAAATQAALAACEAALATLSPSPLFSRISASRPPAHAICAFAGGEREHTILSACSTALLSCFSTRTVLPLRAACKEARTAVARQAWADAATPIRGSVAAWRACFPAAREALATDGQRGTPLGVEDLAHLRGLRRLNLLGCAPHVVAAARSGALPGTRLVGPLLGQCVQQLVHGHSASGLAVVGNTLVSGGFNNSVLSFWDAASLQSLGSMQGNGGRIAALPGERFVTAGYSTPHAAVFDAASRSLTCTIAGEFAGDVWHAAALPGDLVALCSSDKTVSVCSASTGALLHKLTGHCDWVRGVAALEDGRLASSSDDCTVRLWDPARHYAASATLRHANLVLACAALEGNRLASGCTDTNVYIWSATSLALQAKMGGHAGYVQALAALPGNRLASGCWSAEVRVWDLHAHACVALLKGAHTAHVSSIALLPGQGAGEAWRLAVGTTGDGGIICVWEVREEQASEEGAA